MHEFPSEKENRNPYTWCINNIAKMFQIVPCTIFDWSWKFHKKIHKFMRSPVMLLTHRLADSRTEVQTDRQTGRQTDRQTNQPNQPPTQPSTNKPKPSNHEGCKHNLRRSAEVTKLSDCLQRNVDRRCVYRLEWMSTSIYHIYVCVIIIERI